MDLRDFLARVSPPGNKYAARLRAHSSGGTYFWHDAASNYDDLAALIRKFASSDKKEEIYFALSSFRMALVEKNGKMRPHRKQENVDRLKSLWVDVDVGPEKDYTSRKAALEALQSWLTTENILAPTVIVDSGGGYHVYWTFTEAIVPSRWQPMAEALKVSGQKHGFKADWKCTIDSARVLRPPETENYKLPGNARKVTVVQALPNDIAPDSMALNLQRFMSTLGSGLGQGPGVAGGINDALSSGTYRADRKYRVGPVIQNCAVMQHVADTGGEGHEEPFWMAALHLVGYCEDGHDWIHTLSDKYAGYTHAKTEAKFQERLDVIARSKAPDASEAEKKVGPILCKSFEGFYPAGCAGCPHRGRIPGPLHFGDKEEGGLPWPYSREQGKIYRASFGGTEDKPKPPQLVCNFDVEEVETAFDEDDIKSVYFWQILTATHKQYRKIHFETLSASNPGPALARAGITIPEAETRKRFAEFMISFVEQLERARADKKHKEKCYGWTDGKDTGFSMNGTTYWADGTSRRTNRARTGLAEIYEPCGDEAKWREAAQLMRPTMTPALEMLLATSFAGPLVSKVSPYSTIISFRSDDTGVGKTLVLKLAQAVWGDPSKAPMQLTDTVNAITSVMGNMGNYPSYWDEVRIHNNVEAGLDLLMQIGQGREKRRLTASSELKTFGSWHSMLVITTNESLIDHIHNANMFDDAALTRTFEITVNGTHKNNHDLNRAVGLLHRNYGRMGQIYSKYLVDNDEAITALIKKTLPILDKAPDLEGNRFASTTLCALLVGATAAKAAGIYNFNPQRIYDAFLEALHVPQDEVLQDKDVLMNYLRYYQHQQLVVDKKAAHGPGNKVSIIQDPRNTTHPIAFQIVRDDKYLLVPSKSIHAFAYQQRLTSKEVRRQLENRYGADYSKIVLFAGTHYTTAQTMGYYIPITGDLDWLLSGL